MLPINKKQMKKTGKWGKCHSLFKNTPRTTNPKNEKSNFEWGLRNQSLGRLRMSIYSLAFLYNSTPTLPLTKGCYKHCTYSSLQNCRHDGDGSPKAATPTRHAIGRPSVGDAALGGPLSGILMIAISGNSISFRMQEKIIAYYPVLI